MQRTGNLASHPSAQNLAIVKSIIFWLCRGELLDMKRGSGVVWHVLTYDMGQC